MSQTFDAAKVWTEIEDCLYPFLGLKGYERAVYYYLVRHSRLMGTRRLCISLETLGVGTSASRGNVRDILRRLARKGCLRILRRSNFEGHVLQVFLPREIPGCVTRHAAAVASPCQAADCFRDPALRRAVIRREKGRCFYCLRELPRRKEGLDHLVPQVRNGDHSYRNIVACCGPCNRAKGDRAADDFLRELFRRNRLSTRELDARLAALAAIQQGRAPTKPQASPRTPMGCIRLQESEMAAPQQ